MTVVALVFASLASLLHVYFWWLESITWKKPSTWKIFGLASQEEADATASLAYNQGFYNLFLAIGAAVGVKIQIFCDSWDDVSWTLIIFACGSMVAASMVLLTSGKSYLRGALIQGTIPLLAVIASVIAIQS